MKFLINESSMPYDYEPIYNKVEQSFFTKPDAINEFSIMIKGAYTSLDVSLISSTVYCVSGFNPQQKWLKAKLSFPDAIKGALQVVLDGDVMPGTGVDYATNWETYFDQQSGIVCIGQPSFTDQVVNVQFNCNTIAGVMNQTLVAIWIKPKFI